MEKGPEIGIIGKTSPEKKDEQQEVFRRNLYEHNFARFTELSPQERADMEKAEIPKSEKQMAIIDLVNAETNRLMTELGCEPYNVPAKNYHLIPAEMFVKLGMGNAFSYYVEQGILFRESDFRSNPLNFASIAIHETTHLKGRISVEVQEHEGEMESELYRSGVLTRKRHKPSRSFPKAEESIPFLNYLKKIFGHREEVPRSQPRSTSFKDTYPRFHFEGLNEAIVSTIERRLLPRLLDAPELATEKEWLESPEAKERRRIESERVGKREDEIMWVGKDENDVVFFSYPEHRKVLEYICSEVQKEFSQKYISVDDVFREFMKAHFTGRLLPIARIVDKTFGKGSFRKLSEMKLRRETDAHFLLKELITRRTKKESKG